MGLPLRGASLLKHAGIKTLQVAFPERAAERIVDRKLNKMSAFGDLMERMSNGLRDSTPFICESSWIWVSAVIRKSLSWGRAGLTKLMSVCDYTSRHTGMPAERNTPSVSNYRSWDQMGAGNESEMLARC